MSFLIQLVIMVAVWLAPLSQADAQIGSLLRRGVTAVGKKLGIVGRESAEESAKRVVSDSSTVAGSKGLIVSGGVAKASGSTVKPLATAGTSVAVRTGTAASKEIVENLGKESAKALKKLSPKGVAELAEISGELAKSPYRSQWLDMLATYGDQCASFLWKRKGSVAIAAVATAVVVSPDDFLQASENIVTTVVEATGSNFVEPLVTGTAERIVAPVVEEVAANAAAAFPWTVFWFCCGGGLFSCVSYWCFVRSR